VESKLTPMHKSPIKMAVISKTSMLPVNVQVASMGKAGSEAWH